MAAETIRVRGLRETQRALKHCEGRLDKSVQAAGKLAAVPVAELAKQKLSRYQGASVNTIRPRASVRGAFVTQGAKKVTGLRGDFGALQMTQVLMPALEEKRDEVIGIYEAQLGLLFAKEF